MNGPKTAAFVGCAGGAGTTRLTIEAAATLARAGHAAAVIDLDFATQGLAAYVPGDVHPDATALLTDDVAPHRALADLAPDSAGRLAVCPASAPFARVAEAKTPAAAKRVASVVADLLLDLDYVLFDVPPVVENQAIAGVTVADRVAGVIPPTERGVDALARERGRLADVDSGIDLVVANHATPETAPPDADVAIPVGAFDGPDAVCLHGTGTAFAPAVAALVEDLFEIDLPIEFERTGVVDRVRDRLA